MQGWMRTPTLPIPAAHRWWWVGAPWAAKSCPPVPVGKACRASSIGELRMWLPAIRRWRRPRTGLWGWRRRGRWLPRTPWLWPWWIRPRCPGVASPMSLALGSCEVRRLWWGMLRVLFLHIENWSATNNIHKLMMMRSHVYSSSIILNRLTKRSYWGTEITSWIICLPCERSGGWSRSFGF